MIHLRVELELEQVAVDAEAKLEHALFVLGGVVLERAISPDEDLIVCGDDETVLSRVHAVDDPETLDQTLERI